MLFMEKIFKHLGIKIGILVSIIALIMTIASAGFKILIAFFPLTIILESFDIGVNIYGHPGIHPIIFITLGIIFYIIIGYTFDRCIQYLGNKSYKKILLVPFSFFLGLALTLILMNFLNHREVLFTENYLYKTIIIITTLCCLSFLITTVLALIVKKYQKKNLEGLDTNNK